MPCPDGFVEERSKRGNPVAAVDFSHFSRLRIPIHPPCPIGYGMSMSSSQRGASAKRQQGARRAGGRGPPHSYALRRCGSEPEWTTRAERGWRARSWHPGHPAMFAYSFFAHAGLLVHRARPGGAGTLAVPMSPHGSTQLLQDFAGVPAAGAYARR